jgi:tetratricopeptide (TPR) repeat protein
VALRQGRDKEAVAHFGKARELREAFLTSQPDNVWAYLELAGFLTACQHPQLRDAARARELVEKALVLVPESGAAWYRLGLAHYRGGDWKAAVAALEKTERLLEGNIACDVSFFLAMARWQSGDRERARRDYERAVRWLDENASLPYWEDWRQFAPRRPTFWSAAAV